MRSSKAHRYAASWSLAILILAAGAVAAQVPLVQPDRHSRGKVGAVSMGEHVDVGRESNASPRREPDQGNGTVVENGGASGDPREQTKLRDPSRDDQKAGTSRGSSRGDPSLVIDEIRVS